MNRAGVLLIGLFGALALWGYQKKDTVTAAASDAAQGVMDMFTARGIRNNNPGNIRHGASWQGMAAQQLDAAFVTFKTPEYGIRAISKIIDTYSSKYGINTVRGVIEKWAPPNENDTESYVQAVSDEVGVSPDSEVNLSAIKPDLIAAIIRHENGQQPYNVAQINSGSKMA